MFGLDFAACVIFFVVLILTYYVLGRRRQYSDLPPGPTPYPFLGNFLQFAGKHFLKTLRKFRKEYGDIFTVEILGSRIIVIAGYENIKDVLVKKGSAFSNRPHLPTVAFKGDGLIMANGEIWKHNRRFTIHTLRDFGMGKNQLQFKIHEEIGYFLDAIEEHRGQPFDIKDQLNIAVSNVIGSVIFGQRFDYHDKKFLSYVHALDEIVHTFSFSKPEWLRHIPGDPLGLRRLVALAKSLTDFYETNIGEHYRNFDANNIRDLIDAYIKQRGESTVDGETTLMNHDNLIRIVHDLFVAGTETTTTTLRFAMVFLLRNHDIQARLSDDLQNNVPCNRLPDLSDKPNLTYLDATIFEVLRRSCLTPYSVPHSVTEETRFKGYTLPKSALIFPDLESVLMDDVLWDEPQIFNPSRFLDENMKIKNTEYLIPFSVGPRVCLGEGLAKMELYLFLSAMLQRFQFLPPEGEDPPNLDFSYGHVHSPKGFKLRAIKK